MLAALPGNEKDNPVNSDWIDAVGETLSVSVIVKLPGFAVSNVNTAVACCEMLSVTPSATNVKLTGVAPPIDGATRPRTRAKVGSRALFMFRSVRCARLTCHASTLSKQVPFRG